MDRDASDAAPGGPGGLTPQRRKLLIAAVVVVFLAPIVLGLLRNAAVG